MQGAKLFPDSALSSEFRSLADIQTIELVFHKQMVEKPADNSQIIKSYCNHSCATHLRDK